MATLIANLNGGDAITADSDLTYKIYNDTDSYSVAEAFGSHTSDSDVSVAAGVVTITNVTEPSGVTAYKISSVDEAGNESTLSDAKGSYLFFDTFGGTTLDTSKWTAGTNANVTISQNNKLIFTDDATSTSAGIIACSSDGKFETDLSGDLFLIVNIDDSGLTNAQSPRLVSLANDGVDDRVGIYNHNGGDQLQAGVYVFNNGVNQISEITPSITLHGTWKIALESGTVSYYKWNGTTWGSVLATSTYDTSAINIFVNSSRDSRTYAGNVWSIDNIYLLDTDISTQYPS